LKVAIYARVSTEEQHKENQTPVLEEWARSRGWEIAKVYGEDATSWKAGHQKELAQLLKDARMGQFKIVLIWALDRICRGGPSEIFPLLKTLNGYDCKVFSYQEHWTEQPDNMMYGLLISVYSWVAEMESKRRSERTKLGMIRAKEKGTKSGNLIGRPKGKKDGYKRKRLGYLLRNASEEQKEKYGEAII
jgi:DNA invertase Pin-like site-specific DNA recombinase